MRKKTDFNGSNGLWNMITGNNINKRIFINNTKSNYNYNVYKRKFSAFEVYGKNNNKTFKNIIRNKYVHIYRVI